MMRWGLVVLLVALAGCVDGVRAPDAPTQHVDLSCEDLAGLPSAANAPRASGLRDPAAFARAAVAAVNDTAGDMQEARDGDGWILHGKTEAGGAMFVQLDAQREFVKYSYHLRGTRLAASEAAVVASLESILEAAGVQGPAPVVGSQGSSVVQANAEQAYDGVPVGPQGWFDANGGMVRVHLPERGRSTQVFIGPFYDLASIPPILRFREAEGFAQAAIRCDLDAGGGPGRGADVRGQDPDYHFDVVDGRLAYEVVVSVGAACPLHHYVTVHVDAVTGALLSKSAYRQSIFCDGQTEDPTMPAPSPAPPEPNRPPLAVLRALDDDGRETTVASLGSTVVLDASLSTDPDGTIASGHLAFTLDGTARLEALVVEDRLRRVPVTFDAPGRIGFVLVLTDDDGAQASAGLEIAIDHPQPGGPWTFAAALPGAVHAPTACEGPTGGSGDALWYAKHELDVRDGATWIEADVDGDADIALCGPDGEPLSDAGAHVETSPDVSPVAGTYVAIVSRSPQATVETLSVVHYSDRA